MDKKHIFGRNRTEWYRKKNEKVIVYLKIIDILSGIIKLRYDMKDIQVI